MPKLEPLPATDLTPRRATNRHVLARDIQAQANRAEWLALEVKARGMTRPALVGELLKLAGALNTIAADVRPRRKARPSGQ